LHQLLHKVAPRTSNIIIQQQQALIGSCINFFTR